MRCPSCNKFPSFEIQEPEWDSDPELDCGERGEPQENGPNVVKPGDTGQSVSIRGACRLVLTSECCGDEMKEANFDPETEVTFAHVEGCQSGEVDFEGDVTLEAEDHYESTNPKTGKPIPSRYRKHFYGVRGSGTLKCPECGVAEDFELFDEVQASGMDELA
jgi:hypothetical protein